MYELLIQKFKPKLIIAGVLIAALGLLYGVHKLEVHKAVSQARAEMSAEYNKRLLEASEKAREREQAMMGSAEQTMREKDAKIAATNARLASALDSLRQRPSRPSGDAKGSCDCQGANGSQLSREDAGFLVRESARADRVRAGLMACYKQYDDVAKALK